MINTLSTTKITSHGIALAHYTRYNKIVLACVPGHTIKWLLNIKRRRMPWPSKPFIGTVPSCGTSGSSRSRWEMIGGQALEWWKSFPGRRQLKRLIKESIPKFAAEERQENCSNLRWYDHPWYDEKYYVKNLSDRRRDPAAYFKSMQRTSQTALLRHG